MSLHALLREKPGTRSFTVLRGEDPRVRTLDRWLRGAERRGFQTPAGAFDVRFEARDGAAGEVVGNTIYLDPGQSRRELRATLFHELGHLIDRSQDAGQRGRYRRVRGERRGWYSGADPAYERFAEDYGLTLAGARQQGSSAYGVRPSPQEMDQLGGVFSRYARPPRRRPPNGAVMG